MTFGERLYELRTRENISQEKFAEIMDVSRQSISKWETDKAYPEMTRLIFMSDYFDVSLDYLVRGKEYAQQTKEELLVGEQDRKYSADKIWTMLTNFISNLSKKQKTQVSLMSVVLSILLLIMIYILTYNVGSLLGEIIYK